MIRKCLVASVLLVIALLGLTTHALAQSATAEVNGTATDSTGAVIPNAAVVLKNLETQISLKTTSNGSGSFFFVNIPPGSYSLTLSAPGFKTTTIDHFELAVNQTFTQAMKLEVGGSGETIEVSASAAELLQKSSAELGTVIKEDVVQDLPLNGRNFTQLLTLTPGATPVSTAQGSGVGTQDAGISGIPNSAFSKPALHGQQNRSTLYYMDGVTNTDLRGPVYGVLPMVDSIREFKVQAHNDKAEYGGVVGGVVNIISKSGTNAFHGTAFEFLRNNFFDARDPFKDAQNPGPAPFHQNQFGATLGGPIWKDHTFFFFSYEGWRYSRPTQSFTYVPTAAELSGDFTNSISNFALYNPYTTVSAAGGKFNRSRFTCDANGNPIAPTSSGTQVGGSPCQKLPASLVSPFMVKLFSTFLQKPNYTGATVAGAAGTNYVENRAATDNANNYQIRLDHNISSRDNIWARFTNMYVTDVQPVTGTIEKAPSIYHAYNWGAGYTRVLTQRIIYDAQAGLLLKPYNFNQNTIDNSISTIQSLGIADSAQWGGLFASLGSPYLTQDIGTRGVSVRKNPTWSASTNITLILGKHNAKAGLQFTNVQRVQENTYQQYSFNASQTQLPSNTSSTGNVLASALLGLPNSYTGQLPKYSEDDFSFRMWSGYIQDEWRVAPRLTVNYGVRYDYLTVPKVLNGRTSAELDLFNQKYIIGSAPIPDCSAAQQNPCVPGAGFASVPHNTNIVYTGFNKSFLAPKASQFQPRLGLAYQLSEKTVLRAAYGLYFDALPARSQYAQNQLEAASWPWATGFNGNVNTTGSAVTPIGSIEGHFPNPVASASPWSIGGYYDDPHFKPAYSNQWNLELQQEFGRSTGLSIAYVGSSNGNLDYTGYANAARVASPAGTAGIVQDQYRAIPWMISNLRWGSSTGRSNYNALETRLMRQVAQGMRLILSYTWGKSIDNSSGYFAAENGIGGGSAVQNYFDPRSARSVSSYDIPHFVSASVLYDLPAGHGKQFFNHGVASYILGDWQSNVLLQARSGQVYNLTVNGDIANISGSVNTGLSGYGRPNIVGDPFQPGPVAANPTCTPPAGPVHSTRQWFNPCAFTIPSGTFGNYSRNAMRGGPAFNTDLSMFKTFLIREPLNLQLRFEAFNVFNVQSLAPPGAGNSNQVLVTTTPVTTGTGAISAVVYQPRELQFGARFTF